MKEKIGIQKPKEELYADRTELAEKKKEYLKLKIVLLFI